MILVDPRVGPEKPGKPPKNLAPPINKMGIKAENSILPYGDIAFSGNGPDGTVTIGIELKSLHGMLSDIDDARFTQQCRGMRTLYDVRYLLIEGVWGVGGPPFQEGILIESNTGGCTWGPCRYRSQRVVYSKLFRYLLSVNLSGFTVLYSRDIHHTAVNVCEVYHYWQKKWNDHTALRETQKFSLPTLNGKPSLTRKWAAQITDIGVKLSEEAEAMFKTPIRLATADEVEWMRLGRIGAKTAQQIVREIHGERS